MSWSPVTTGITPQQNKDKTETKGKNGWFAEQVGKQEGQEDKKRCGMPMKGGRKRKALNIQAVNFQRPCSEMWKATGRVGV